ncbi:protein FAR1-RELATED SEQUENCE 5-like [Amborella trichopoda]|uniref:protein FAR1-RELATED SEQUENCE 5-like n=1 Tax=Amborella trichopoda TaxID=13333 RepID=UPI0005D30200|nr:protein FAR1-RELATED SEQUENCE 5-like [Amborella trichopoda]|eukprot:XP_011626826.1 protein FAR1-RELATED SEQUENCE 5-like [Amborella trichopoda]
MGPYLKLGRKNIIDLEAERISSILVVEEYSNNETDDIIHVDGENGSDSYASQDETCTVDSKLLNLMVRSHKKIKKPFSTQVGGLRSLPFVEVDCKNAIYNNQKKKSKLVGGDAEGLMEFFSTKSAMNALFAYKIQVDENGCLTNAIWLDAKLRIAYKYFGDVIIFDTTYKTNAYGMPVLGVNHYTKTLFFGCALLHREGQEFLTWLFTKWLEVMNGRQPKIIITDRDREMALAMVFSESRHQLYRWHITKKIEQKVVEVEHKHSSFHGDLYKCIDHCTTIMEFEDEW